MPLTVMYPASEWCRENFGRECIVQVLRSGDVPTYYDVDPTARWLWDATIFRFKSKTDAAAFKIMWYGL
jgi:hypothetical protein